MPDWCINHIRVAGSPGELKKFQLRFYGFYAAMSENGMVVKHGYSFENFIPLDYNELLQLIRSDKINKKDISSVIKSWIYEQYVEKWGVSSDIQQREFSVAGLESLNEDSEIVELGYTIFLPWSHCQPVIEQMAYDYPNLEFEFKYEEASSQIAGIVKYQGGEVVSERHSEMDDYREFMLIYFEEEYLLCKGCNQLVEPGEIDDETDHCCPFCEEKDFHPANTTKSIIKERMFKHVQ